MATDRTPDRCTCHPRCLDQSVDRHPGRDPHGIEDVGEILDRDISARIGRERATAEATDTGVQPANTVLDGHERVGDREAPRVVQVRAERHIDRIGHRC